MGYFNSVSLAQSKIGMGEMNERILLQFLVSFSASPTALLFCFPPSNQEIIFCEKKSSGMHHYDHQGDTVTYCNGLTATHICDNVQESDKYFKRLSEKAVSGKQIQGSGSSMHEYCLRVLTLSSLFSLPASLPFYSCRFPNTIRRILYFRHKICYHISNA
jgi:hypothetical protein